MIHILSLIDYREYIKYGLNNLYEYVKHLKVHKKRRC